MYFLAVLGALLAPTLPTGKDLPQVRKALDRGIGYLVTHQNEDGSWGDSKNYTMTLYWNNTAMQKAYGMATSALCVMALAHVEKTPEVTQALEKGVDYLTRDAYVGKPLTWDDNQNWPYLYGLQAMTEVYDLPIMKDRRKAIRKRGLEYIAGLKRFQCTDGGWGYLSFDGIVTRFTSSPSFMTASVIIALEQAKALGWEVPQYMVDRAVRIVLKNRLPNGAYSYGNSAVPTMGGLTRINQVKGSLCRIPVCNLALRMTTDKITDAMIRQGMDDLFNHHEFIDIARYRPRPHEAFYQNSGYFYLYGHYYAARLLEHLKPEDQDRYWSRLVAHSMKQQAPDGSWWDYQIGGFTKPYGTAYVVLVLKLALNNQKIKAEQVPDSSGE